MKDLPTTRDMPVLCERERCANCKALLGMSAYSAVVGRKIVTSCGSRYCRWSVMLAAFKDLRVECVVTL